MEYMIGGKKQMIDGCPGVVGWPCEARYCLFKLKMHLADTVHISFTVIGIWNFLFTNSVVLVLNLIKNPVKVEMNRLGLQIVKIDSYNSPARSELLIMSHQRLFVLKCWNKIDSTFIFL